MRVLLRFTLSFTVLTWCALAQHGGGGHGSSGGGSHSGSGSAFHGGGTAGGSYRAYGGYGGGHGFGYGFYGGRGYGYGGYGRGWGYGVWGRPYWGWGYPGYSAYWPYYSYGYPYYSYGYYDDPDGYYYPDTYTDPGYAYAPDPGMTYAPPAQAYAAPSSYTSAAHPVIHSYDQYGQEVARSGSGGASSSPIYLFALKDGQIQAAASYSIAGETLHYVTMDHQEKQVALSSIDRALTQQLNRERRVPVALPAQ